MSNYSNNSGNSNQDSVDVNEESQKMQSELKG